MIPQEILFAQMAAIQQKLQRRRARANRPTNALNPIWKLKRSVIRDRKMFREAAERGE